MNANILTQSQFFPFQFLDNDREYRATMAEEIPVKVMTPPQGIMTFTGISSTIDDPIFLWTIDPYLITSCENNRSLLDHFL